MTETALEVFERDGVVRVPAVLGRDEVVAMREAFLATLAERQVEARLVAMIGARRPAPGTEEDLWAVGRHPAFEGLPAVLARAAESVFGAGVWEPTPGQRGGLAAPNFPLPGVWTVPHEAWHVDEPTTAGRASSWGLLGFAFIDDVEPGGGATVAIAGSHRRLLRVADELRAPGGLLTTEEAMGALAASESWFAELFRAGPERRRFLEEHVSRGIPVRVVELTGSAGDITLMDPRCLHTLSPNVSGRARLTMRMVCARSA